jgi:hypothetical protein
MWFSSIPSAFRKPQSAPTKALQVGKAGMRTNLDPVLLCQPHRGAHVVEITGVKAAGNVGDMDQRHHPRIVAHAPKPEAFAHVTIDRDWHLTPCSYSNLFQVGLPRSSLQIRILAIRYRKTR